MGTANFHFNDTLYALDDCDDEFLFEDTKENIKYAIKRFKNLEHVGVFFDGINTSKGSNVFDGLVVVDCYAKVLVDDLVGNESINFTVNQLIVLRVGYYSGFNLDRYYGNDEGDYFESLDEVTDNFDYYCDRHLDLDGLFNEEDDEEDDIAKEDYINNVVKPRFEELLAKIDEEFDTVYHSLGKEFFEEYVVSAQFSSGETMYFKV